MILWSVVMVPMVAGGGLWIGPAGWTRRRLAAAAGAALGATCVLAVIAVTLGEQTEYGWGAGLSITLTTGRSASVLAVLVPAVAAGVAIYAAFHEERRGLGRLVGGLVVFVGAMEVLVLADDVLTLLTAWELVGACSWALIAHEWRTTSKVQAAGHAFLATRLGDLGLFVAAGAAFAGGDRSLGYAGLGQLHGAPLHMFVGGVLLAAVAKAGQLPFSPWLFSAMAGPTSVSALLHAATMVAAGAFILVRLHPVLALVGWFTPVTVGIGLCTALVGGVVALAQTHGKKVLAASTSAHYGLMFVAVGAGYPAAALAHLVAHAVVKAGLFMSAGVAGDAAGSYELGRQRLGRVLPGVAVVTFVMSLALAGVPPLGGGWTKEAVISAAGHRGPLVALLTALAGALSAAYALRFQFLAFGRRNGRTRRPERSPTRGETVMLVIFAVVCVMLGALWLPGSDAVVERVTGTVLPAGQSWELAVSLALIAVAAAAVVAADRRDALLDQHQGSPRWLAATEWLALPRFVEVVVVRPTLWSAMWASVHIEPIFDIPTRVLAAPRSARCRSTVPTPVPPFDVPRTAAWVAAADRLVIDAGIRLTVRATEWLAIAGSRRSEHGVDGAVDGVATGVGSAGRSVRRLQTGLAHQYYVLIAATTLVAAIIVAVWR